MTKLVNQEALAKLISLIGEENKKFAKKTDLKAVATTGNYEDLTGRPTFKTINGESVTGTGNITIDLSLYRLVESLPEIAEADSSKIYLVANGQSGGNNIYTEYGVVNGQWEVLGEYSSEVDLSGYAKLTDLDGYVRTADLSEVTQAEVQQLWDEANA
ncbi:hypothetical protein [uncultured Duncaniella sp.]|uniref:hypothetical protein n=1 Tax=uncultured Duncaniella sp. TaxID=2768039 RepID=UPI0025A95BE4|nr:hypothetical protein [uncultured Duncaniella sp.]